MFLGIIVGLNAFGGNELVANVNASVREANIGEAYDGETVTPTTINKHNYLYFGLTDDNWSLYDGYYGIRDAKELFGFASMVNKVEAPKHNAVLLANIIVNEEVSETGAQYSWEPITGKYSGNAAYNAYSGTFDGNGYSINMSINRFNRR